MQTLVSCETFNKEIDRLEALLEPCPEAMTRAELIALSNSSSLRLDCHYAIPYNRECVGEATILLHATDSGTLSRNAHIQTTHDNEAWRGEYDLTTNRITSLEDNLGNRVYGRYGNEVDRWDWGNTRLTENFVDNADVFLTKDSTTLTLRNNRFENDSSSDFRGTIGIMQNSSISDDSILELDDANVNILALSMASRARIYGERSTNVRIYYTEMESEAYWQFRDQNEVRSQGSTFSSTARVYYYGGTRQWFYYTEISSFGYVRQYDGDLRLYYSNVDSYAGIRNEAGSDIFIIYGGKYSSRAYIRNFNTNEVRHYYTNVDSRAEIRHEDASRQIVYYSSVSDYGWMYLSGTVTVVYTQNIDSQARAYYTAGTHYRNRFSNLSTTTMPFNTRSVYVHGRRVTTLTAANTNRGRDYFNNSLI